MVGRAFRALDGGDENKLKIISPYYQKYYVLLRGRFSDSQKEKFAKLGKRRSVIK